MGIISVTVSVLLCVQFSIFSVTRSYIKDTTPISVLLLYSEFLKFVYSFLMSYKERHILFKDVTKVLPVCALFIVSNIISFWSMTKVSASIYVMFMQLKLPWTMILSKIITDKIFTVPQVFSVIILFICCINVASRKNMNNSELEFLPILSMVTETLISSTCGIYIQKMFDNSNKKTWLRNTELSILSIPFYLTVCFYKNYSVYITNYGWMFSFLAAIGGILVAYTILYCGAMTKNVVTAFSIIVVTTSEHIIYFKVPTFSNSSFYLIGSLCVLLYSFSSNNNTYVDQSQEAEYLVNKA